MSKKETATKTAILRDNGVKIVTPSAELMDGLKKVGAKMLKDWEKAAGSEGATLLKDYRN